jgi:Domain of unknown function (DUF222)
MGAPSPHGPYGPDGDPARHPDDASVPWEPVITRPDPMTAQEWQAQAWADFDPAEDTDPETHQDEDDFLSPGADLTGAELAEIAEATWLAAPATADDLDPAGVARVLAAQAAAASARRRGPGQPGSARLLAGESCSPAGAFGTGQLLDVMPACPDLAVLADRAAGEDDSYAGVSDDELIGLMCAWDRIESHMAARKLAATAELSRRRPPLETPSSGRPAGSADEDFTADELAHVLAISRREAGTLLTVAEALDGKLPGTRALLRDGIITLAKAQIIVNNTTLLNKKEAAEAEAKVLGRAGRITPGSLRAAIAQAVMEVAPKKAKDRREHAARRARVERWAEDSGNGALAGRELPPASVLAMDQRITWWALQLRAAGLEGDMDQLRARALADLVTGTDSRPGHHGPGTSPVPGGFAANVNLTVPLTTTLDLADRPGDLAGFGPVDPWLARDLARAAAANPKTTWCATFTDQDGHAVAHGCARPQSTSHRRHSKHGRPGFAFTRTSRDGPPGGHGTWTLHTPGPGPDLTIELHPLTTENCDHRFEAKGHDPGVKLRHLAQIRHATCVSPVCRRPAATCDYEHNTPYEAGGKTCLCNGGPKCRHDHRIKQHPRWKVEQLPDGTFRWTTPSGRTYDTEPTRYPV